jgi:hypothetical protein
VEVRYEQLAADPGAVASQLASALDVPERPLAEALHHAHGASVGRHARDLEGQDRADVLEEAGDLLRELGYLQSV